MEKHRVAVIGVGYWGPNHVRTFDSLPNSEVVGVADTDVTRLFKLNAKARREEHYQYLLDDSQIDAVVVSTPTDTHYEIVKRSLKSGKHVLCEKPLCRSVAQAEELVALASKENKILMTGHVFLFNPSIVKLKELIMSGEVGAVRYISAIRTNLGPVRYDVNSVYDLATHDVSIANWLFDRAPISASATGMSLLNPDIEDVSFATLTYSENRLAHIHTSWIDPRKVRQITVVGDKRMIVWDDLQPSTPLAIYDKGVVPEYNSFGEFSRATMWDGDVRLPMVAATEPLRAQAIEFLKYVESGTVEKSDGAFSIDVVRALEVICASMKLQGVPVML